MAFLFYITKLFFYLIYVSIIWKSFQIPNRLSYNFVNSSYKYVEYELNFFLNFVKYFLLILIIFYIDTILEKVENSDYDIGWNFILIPLDIVGALFAFYWIIFLYSYKSINLKHKWKLYVCIGIITIGILIDIVLLPNFKNKVAMSPFIPIGVNICVTLATIYYFIYLKKMDKKIETDLS